MANLTSAFPLTGISQRYCEDDEESLHGAEYAAWTEDEIYTGLLVLTQFRPYPLHSDTDPLTAIFLHTVRKVSPLSPPHYSSLLFYLGGKGRSRS